MHVAGVPGSHAVVRHVRGASERAPPPRDVAEAAASLCARADHNGDQPVCVCVCVAHEAGAGGTDADGAGVRPAPTPCDERVRERVRRHRRCYQVVQ